jgi:aminoglycoside 6-adenylyltransferase
MLDEVIRNEQLLKMMKWHIGVQTDFQVNPGKLGKYFEKYLQPELWELLLKTFSDASYENTWDALLTACNLFRKVAVPIAKHFGFEYPFEDDRRVSAHLEHVRTLPRDAKEIYA